jgi:exosome complex component RRP4
MGIIILPPAVEDIVPRHEESDDSMSVDSDEDVEMSGVRSQKRARIGNETVSTGVVTPGEVVTDDPQWMRLVVQTQRRGFSPLCSLRSTLLS